MAQKLNPILVKFNLNRSSDPSWFSDYYHGKLLYQDLNFRDYSGSIRPPETHLAFVPVGVLFIILLKGHSFMYLFLIDLANQDIKALGRYNLPS